MPLPFSHFGLTLFACLFAHLIATLFSAFFPVLCVLRARCLLRVWLRSWSGARSLRIKAAHARAR